MGVRAFVDDFWRPVSASKNSVPGGRACARSPGAVAAAFRVCTALIRDLGAAHIEGPKSKLLRRYQRRGCSVGGACPLCKVKAWSSVGDNMETNFLKAQAERCRSLAENTDEFTKRRLLDLAAKYDKQLTAARPSATRILRAPFGLKDAPKHI